MISAIIIDKSGSYNKISIPSDFDELDSFLSDILDCYTVVQHYDDESGLCCFFDDSFYISSGTEEDYAKEENTVAEKIMKNTCKIYGSAIFAKFIDSPNENVRNITLLNTRISDIPM